VTRLRSGPTDTRLSIPARDNIFSCRFCAQPESGTRLPLHCVTYVQSGPELSFLFRKYQVFSPARNSASSSGSTRCSVRPGTQLPLHGVPGVQPSPGTELSLHLVPDVQSGPELNFLFRKYQVFSAARNSTSSSGSTSTTELPFQ